MIKDVIDVGKNKILGEFSKADVESLMKELDIEDIYSTDFDKHRKDIISLIEILGVTLVALKGQNSALQVRCSQLENNK